MKTDRRIACPIGRRAKLCLARSAAHVSTVDGVCCRPWDNGTHGRPPFHCQDGKLTPGRSPMRTRNSLVDR